MAMGAKVRFLSSFSFFFFSPSFFSPSLYLCLSFFLFQQIQTHYSSSSSTILETHDYLSNEVSPFLYPPTLSPPFQTHPPILCRTHHPTLSVFPTFLRWCVTVMACHLVGMSCSPTSSPQFGVKHLLLVSDCTCTLIPTHTHAGTHLKC